MYYGYVCQKITEQLPEHKHLAVRVANLEHKHLSNPCGIDDDLQAIAHLVGKKKIRDIWDVVKKAERTLSKERK